MFRELIQLAVSVKRYISSPENALEMIMIGLVLWIITQNTEENVSFLSQSYVFPLVVSPCSFPLLFPLLFPLVVLWIIT